MRLSVAFVAPLLVVALDGGCSPSPDAQPSASASEPAPVPPPTPSPIEASPTPPPILTPIPQKFRALGTEPFWSANVAGTRLTYSTPESPEGLTITVVRRDAGNNVIYTGTIDGKPLELEIERKICSDGMSDTVYPFAVIRRIGPDNERGCAR